MLRAINRVCQLFGPVPQHVINNERTSHNADRREVKPTLVLLKNDLRVRSFVFAGRIGALQTG